MRARKGHWLVPEARRQAQEEPGTAPSADGRAAGRPCAKGTSGFTKGKLFISIYCFKGINGLAALGMVLCPFKGLGIRADERTKGNHETVFP